MPDSALEWLSGEDLDATLALPGAMLVMFTAQWCPPCQALQPRLERVAQRQGSRVRCYLCDVDKHPEVAAKHGVRGMPTLALFIDGDLEATRVGALDEEQLEAFLGVSL